MNNVVICKQKKGLCFNWIQLYYGIIIIFIFFYPQNIFRELKLYFHTYSTTRSSESLVQRLKCLSDDKYFNNSQHSDKVVSKWPTLFDFVRRPVNEHVEWPHHARDGDNMEGDRAHDLTPLARRHL